MLALLLPNHAETQSCRPTGQAIPAASRKQFAALQKRIEKGVFYRELIGRLGPPQSCNERLEGDTLALTWAFRGNARLEARIDTSLEFSEQRMQLSRLTGERALALLKAAEKDLYGDDGCGIRWKKPVSEKDASHPASWERIYRGTTCNCQARVTYRQKSIVALLMRSAC
ncbi:MAG TPA: hypothetical protein VL240_05670 [Candidatus Binatia bacterium]|nr:hypothetical protein [Candidatus Binatia bacterium]